MTNPITANFSVLEQLLADLLQAGRDYDSRLEAFENAVEVRVAAWDGDSRQQYWVNANAWNAGIRDLRAGMEGLRALLASLGQITGDGDRRATQILSGWTPAN